jgi:pyruvate dehydrogenase E1 component
VVNCNLQRLDGPVRGNGKIINELEASFRGAGWNVIKLIWGAIGISSSARDRSGLLLKRMEECVDGEYQNFKARAALTSARNFSAGIPSCSNWSLI